MNTIQSLLPCIYNNRRLTSLVPDLENNTVKYHSSNLNELPPFQSYIIK